MFYLWPGSIKICMCLHIYALFFFNASPWKYIVMCAIDFGDLVETPTSLINLVWIVF